LLGVVVDNTSKGISDNEQVLKLNERK